MVLASIPLVGLYFRNLHKKWHAKLHTSCNHEHKHDTHVEDEFNELFQASRDWDEWTDKQSKD